MWVFCSRKESSLQPLTSRKAVKWRTSVDHATPWLWKWVFTDGDADIWGGSTKRCDWRIENGGEAASAGTPPARGWRLNDPINVAGGWTLFHCAWFCYAFPWSIHMLRGWANLFNQISSFFVDEESLSLEKMSLLHTYSKTRCAHWSDWSETLLIHPRKGKETNKKLVNSNAKRRERRNETNKISLEGTITQGYVNGES